jgi:Uma2 family endonuclease
MGSVVAADYLDAIEHMPRGATLVVYDVDWDAYEHLVEQLNERPGFRVSYDSGRLEIMTPLPRHETSSRFIDRLLYAYADATNLTVESYGSTTWKSRAKAKGVEPDACYYVSNAEQVIGKDDLDLESDPPPDLAIEIDITNESLSKFPIYAALGVPEIWHYNERELRFYTLTGDTYREVAQSVSFPTLTPALVADALAQSKTDGQTAALREFRDRYSPR